MDREETGGGGGECPSFQFTRIVGHDTNTPAKSFKRHQTPRLFPSNIPTSHPCGALVALTAVDAEALLTES